MKTYSSRMDYATFKPTAVQVIGSGEGRRYEWGVEVSEYEANDPTWTPALANEHSMIDLNTGLLFKKAQAEHEARYIAKQLGIK